MNCSIPFCTFLLILLAGCSCYKKPTDTIKYKPSQESKGFSIEIPKDYKMNFIIGNNYEYKFYNKNGIEIRIGEQSYLNPERKLSFNQDSIDRYKLLVKSILPSDTVINQGIKDSLCWKSIEIYYYTSLVILKLRASYQNVPKDQRHIFDRYLYSIKPLKENITKIDPRMRRYLKNKEKLER